MFSGCFGTEPGTGNQNRHEPEPFENMKAVKPSRTGTAQNRNCSESEPDQNWNHSEPEPHGIWLGTGQNRNRQEAEKRRTRIERTVPTRMRGGEENVDVLV